MTRRGILSPLCLPVSPPGHAGIWRRGSESNRRTRLCRPLHDHSATPPGSSAITIGTAQNDAAAAAAIPTQGNYQERHALFVEIHLLENTANRRWCRRRCVFRNSGAGKESRTPDLNLGKVALYQLSYSRVSGAGLYAYFTPCSIGTAGQRQGLAQVIQHGNHRQNRRHVD